jgi:hypothetical protein
LDKRLSGKWQAKADHQKPVFREVCSIGQRRVIGDIEVSIENPARQVVERPNAAVDIISQRRNAATPNRTSSKAQQFS